MKEAPLVTVYITNFNYGSYIKDAIERSGWRIGARRLIIVVGDAPLKQGQLDKVIRLAAQFGRSGGTISTLDVSDQANPSLLEAKVTSQA